MKKVCRNLTAVFTTAALIAGMTAIPVLAEDELTTSTLTVVENGDRTFKNDGSNRKVIMSVDTQKGIVCRQLSEKTFVNFDLPAMNTDKLIKVNYNLTPKKIGTEQATLNVYGTHIPYTEFLTLSGATLEVPQRTTEYDNETVCANIIKYYDNKTDTNVDITIADLEVDKELKTDITDYIKAQISAGLDDIDLMTEAYSQTTEFYSTLTDVSKAAALEFIVDTSAADEELAVLTNDNFKQFVNTYASYYGIDYRELNKYSNTQSIFNALTSVERWNTHDGFKPAYETAINNIQTTQLVKNSIGNVYFDANNQSNINIKLNQDIVTTIGNNRRHGLIGFDIPKVDNGTIKSAKLIVQQSENLKGTKNISLRAHLGLNVFDFKNLSFTAQEDGTYGTEQEKAEYEKMQNLKTDSNIELMGSRKTITTTSMSEPVEFDITDFMKDCIKDGYNGQEIFFSFSQPWNVGGFSVYTGSQANAAKIVYEIANTEAADDILNCNDAMELCNVLNNLSSDEMTVIGLNADYKKFAYPIYLASYVMNKGYSDLNSFNTALNEAIERYSIEKTIKTNNITYYMTRENGTDTPMQQGLTVGAGSASSIYGRTFYSLDISEKADILDGKIALLNNRDNDDTGRTKQLVKYTSNVPELPDKGWYALGSDEANAFNTWMTTTDFVSDGTKFEFKSANGNLSTTENMTDELLKNLNAVSKNGGKMIFELGNGQNLYISEIQFILTVDGTVAAHERLEKEQNFVEEIKNAASADDITNSIAAYDDLLNLQSDKSYLKAKNAVANELFALKGAFESYDEIADAIMTSIKNNQPTKILEVEKVSYINEPNPAGQNPSPVGYWNNVTIRKYDDTEDVKVIAAVVKKATGELVNCKVVDASNAIASTAYGDIAEIQIGGWFAFDNDENPENELRVFVWDTADSSMQALSDKYAVNAVTQNMN